MSLRAQRSNLVMLAVAEEIAASLLLLAKTIKWGSIAIIHLVDWIETRNNLVCKRLLDGHVLSLFNSRASSSTIDREIRRA